MIEKILEKLFEPVINSMIEGGTKLFLMLFLMPMLFFFGGGKKESRGEKEKN